MRNAYIVLVGKHEGKRSLERSGCRRDDNIKMDLEEIGSEVQTESVCFNIRSSGGFL
jgi:hypothetical protein